MPSRAKNSPFPQPDHHLLQWSFLFPHYPAPQQLHVLQGSLSTFISTFFTWNFITTIFVIWGFFLQRIKEEPGIVTTKLATKGNIIAVVSFYLINMTYRVSLALFMASDRPFTDPADVDNFFISVMYGISSIAFLAAMIYILMLYC